MKYLKKFESFPGQNYTLDILSSGEKDLPDGSTIDPNRMSVIDSKLIYNKDWEKELPKTMTINYKGNLLSFKKGNIMLLGDSVQVTYQGLSENPWGSPDCLEFDLYFTKQDLTQKIKIDIDITLGDLMVCEFSIEQPNKISLIQHTTYHSKFDPSDTVFALEDKSLKEFIVFLNKFSGFKLSRYDLRFLDKIDNWKD